MGALRDEVTDEVIGLLHLRHQGFPARARLYRHKYNIHIIAQPLADHVVQPHKFLIDLLSRHLLAECQIVVSTVNDHLPGMIRINDGWSIPDHVVKRRPAKTPVDNCIAGKVFLYVGPPPEGRATDKKNGVGRWALDAVPAFEFGDLIPKRRLRGTPGLDAGLNAGPGLSAGLSTTRRLSAGPRLRSGRRLNGRRRLRRQLPSNGQQGKA